MLAKFFVVVAGSTIAMSAFAVDANQCAQKLQLKDSSTLHVFADGKMAMENKFGHTEHMAPGTVMQTKDGKTITMNGNETARLSWFLHPTPSGD